jgi:hypothetical protein
VAAEERRAGQGHAVVRARHQGAHVEGRRRRSGEPVGTGRALGEVGVALVLVGEGDFEDDLEVVRVAPRVAHEHREMVEVDRLLAVDELAVHGVVWACGDRQGRARLHRGGAGGEGRDLRQHEAGVGVDVHREGGGRQAEGGEKDGGRAGEDGTTHGCSPGKGMTCGRKMRSDLRGMPGRQSG